MHWRKCEVIDGIEDQINNNKVNSHYDVLIHKTLYLTHLTKAPDI